MNRAWRPMLLADVVDPVGKRDPATSGRRSFRYVDIGSVDGERHRIVGAAELPSNDAPGRARQQLKAHDTLFSTVRPYLEKIAYVDRSLDGEIASTGFCVLRPRDGVVHPRFLFHYMTSRQLLDQVLPLQRGVSYPAVRDRDVLAAKIYLPSWDEQQRIVDIVEDHLSRLDAADRLLTDAATRSARLQKASAAASVQRATQDQRTRVVRLGDVARIGTGATPRRGNVRYWSGGSIPWVTSGELKQGLIERASQHVTDAALAETSIRMWPAGTLLVAMYGEGKTRGTVGELALPATTNQACAAILLAQDDVTSRRWLRLILDTSYDAMRRSASGGVQPNLNLGHFREMLVPWPTEHSMREAITRTERVSERVSALRDAAGMAREKSANLRRLLLASAFSGQLAGNALTFNAAEELANV